uniref:NADH dehydrogenase subunit 2 n=1 Tax=Chlorophanus auripes TaxID=2907322 RepID=UPI001F148591|nr:NADH dehydrogenase subunit 2 [Chlorophanus auripes]UKT60156.1 NADH dehydrogenase subunit 2 [Chlorophanus auripes]
MFKLYKILFFNSMIISTFICISAYSWLSAWIGLEINLLSFIPLLKNQKNKFASEASLKYFIVQVMASSILLFSIIIFMSTKNYLNSMMGFSETLLMSTALLMKLGAAPFHFWLPEVVSGLNWFNIYIILTWQKIAPMVLLTYHIKTNLMFFSSIIIISSIISGISGLNQIDLRKIMAYSSINHMGWMISSLFYSSMNCFNYFCVYCLINLNIILILKYVNVFFLNQLTSILSHNKKLKFFFMLNFLSLGGLPPFIGFLPKWLTINNLINNNFYLLSTILIIFTLISLYFYLRITFSSMTIFSQESLTFFLTKMNYFYFFLNFLSLSGLIICSMIDSIY